MSILSQEHLQNEEAAYAWVEARIWPEGPVCPHCGGKERISKMQGKATRIGLYKCYSCRKQFNVKVGTIFEASHIAMHIWLQAFYLIAGSKKGISSNQLHRTLGVTLKTAWFMGHRIREAMRTGSLAAPTEPMGGAGKIVEADETFVGKKDGKQKLPWVSGYGHKQTVLSLVERGGDVRSFSIKNCHVSTIKPIVDANLRKESRLMTDQAKYYINIGREFAGHETVDHGRGEYVRYTNALVFPSGEKMTVHVNTLENYFSVFKRGMRGVYQHCSEKHLHRYLAEFDFRYNNRIARGVNDEARAGRMVEGAKGKRLTYRTTAD
jgi:transposase-like protein